MRDDLSSQGLSVVGVSPQGIESHQRFSAQYNLDFPLLVDADKQVIKAYGVNGPFGIGVRRASFLIDQQQNIVACIRADFRINHHIEWLKLVSDRSI